MKALLIFFAILAIPVFSFSAEIKAENNIDISLQPSMGNMRAPVQVVAFLEPKCPDSKKYYLDSFPKLKRDFIDRNLVHYAVITASFLPQSMPAAIALLCVYNQDPKHPRADLFFKYLDYIYRNQPPEKDNWATIENLQQFALRASSAIDRAKLKMCIEQEHYRAQIEKNTSEGNRIMGRISTPTIFVDGKKVENKDDTVNYDALKKAINDALQSKHQTH